MAVSANAAFTATRDQLVMDALAMLGGVGPNKTPTGDQLAHGARELNKLVKSMDSDGVLLWKTDRDTFTTTASTASYTLDADILEVDEPINLLQSGAASRSIIVPMSRDDYMSIADRTVEGTPTQYYIEKDLSSGALLSHTMYLYPVPDTTGDTVEHTVHRKARDFDTGSDNPDFPQAWLLCLTLGLAWVLCPTYRQQSRMRSFKDQFDEERMRQLGNDNEKMGITFVPWGAW